MSQEASSIGAPVGDRYTLDEPVGSGAAAIVYAGRDLATDRVVAVKVYRSEGMEGSARHRVEQHREIEALTRLRHPGLVALHDGGSEPGPEGRTYLVTDLVDGPSLDERLDDGPLPVRTVVELGAGLAAALAHVHAGGFVHRDIKPANILLDHGDAPRLADFGIARALDGTVATATGAVAGTAAYLAPEQVRGELVGAPTDVYALGLVLLEALTGRREYPGSMIESATARLHRRPAVPTDLPADLAAVLTAMTDPDPALRPTAEAVAASLTAATATRHDLAAVPTAVAVADDPSTGLDAADAAGPPPLPRSAPDLLRSAPDLPERRGARPEPGLAAPLPTAARRRSRSRLSLPTLAAAAVLVAFLLGGVSLLLNSGTPTVASTPQAGALSPVPLDPPTSDAPSSLGLGPSRPSTDAPPAPAVPAPAVVAAAAVPAPAVPAAAVPAPPVPAAAVPAAADPAPADPAPAVVAPAVVAAAVEVEAPAAADNGGKAKAQDKAPDKAQAKATGKDAAKKPGKGSAKKDD